LDTLPECDHRFFQRAGVGRDTNIIDRYFNVAWLWKWGPRAALDLTLSELILYEAQTSRILEETAPPDNGR